MNAQMNGYNDSKYFYNVRIEKIFKDPSDHRRNGSAGKKRENGLSPEGCLKLSPNPILMYNGGG